MRVRVVVTGRGYHASADLPSELELPAAATIDDALAALAERLPADAPLADSCLLAVAGKHLGTVAQHPSQELRDGDELVIVAPVAGG